jgi:multiple sugar transport system substrate-binding protein
MPESDRPSLELNRRNLLKGTAGVFALGAMSPLLAACGGSSSGGGGGSASGTLSIGSNYSDAGVKKAFASVAADWQKASGNKAHVNTVDHNTFQDKIQQYLQGTPDDVFSWFAGYRMKFFAKQNLASPIDDVWEKIGKNFPDSIKAAAKADDGHYYFVPLYNYPWVMCYRKSVWADKGYEVPANWDDLIALNKKMASDGLTPIAFADKDGWPAMGTFDILNMRINGYQFHVDLMAHNESWTDKKVVAVFDQWKELFPYYSKNINGITWEQGAQALQNKKAGMMFQGAGQVGQQFTPENLKDLAFFPFPEIDSAHGTDSIDAPIDGFMMSKKPKNKELAASFLEYLGSAKAEATYLASDPTDVGTASNYDESSYNDLQKASAEIIAKTPNIAQFLDRDTRPDFAYPTVQNALQGFISNQDSGKATSTLESQAKAIFV